MCSVRGLLRIVISGFIIAGAALMTPGVRHIHEGGDVRHDHANGRAAASHSHGRHHSHTHVHPHRHGHSSVHGHAHGSDDDGEPQEAGNTEHWHVHITILGYTLTIWEGFEERSASNVVPQQTPSISEDHTQPVDTAANSGEPATRPAKFVSAGVSVIASATPSGFWETVGGVKLLPGAKRVGLPSMNGLWGTFVICDERAAFLALAPPTPPPDAFGG